MGYFDMLFGTKENDNTIQKLKASETTNSQEKRLIHMIQKFSNQEEVEETIVGAVG